MKSLVLALSILFPSAATAQTIPPDIKQQILQRCQSQMGNFGASVVKYCVDEDLQAYASLTQYAPEHQAVIQRCQQSMLQIGGWSVVKYCADEDIAAQRALDAY